MKIELYIIITLLIIIIILLVSQFRLKSYNQILKKRNKELQVEMNRIRTDNRFLEAEKLKFQLQPHTVNNLFAQMRVFTNRLNDGMNSLSNTLEYVFYKGRDNYVTIEDELNFIEQYLGLNELFLNELFSIQTDFKGVKMNIRASENHKIPHLITAYFLENAFKHGDKNHPEFLKVIVLATEEKFELNVINKLKPNQSTRKSHGIGLENMKRRLDLFANKRYKITNSCTEHDYHSTLIIHF